VSDKINLTKLENAQLFIGRPQEEPDAHSSSIGGRIYTSFVYQASKSYNQIIALFYDFRWINENTIRKQLKNELVRFNQKNLLTKGYCILFSEKDHSAITTIKNIEKNQEVQILLIDGKLKATINEIIAE